MRRRLRVGSAEWWNDRTRFEPETGCVVYTGFIDPWGYARTSWKGKDGVLVHRVAYAQVYGDFDQSLKVCHSCDNPPCCNPAHLFLGTQKDNLRDMFAKGRARPHGKATPPLTFPSPVAPALAQRVSAPEIKKECVSRWPNTSYPNQPLIPRWRHVTGVPTSRPTQAIQLYTRPISWTHEPEPRTADGYDSSPCCSDSGAMRAASPTPARP